MLRLAVREVASVWRLGERPDTGLFVDEVSQSTVMATEIRIREAQIGATIAARRALKFDAPDANNLAASGVQATAGNEKAPSISSARRSRGLFPHNQRNDMPITIHDSNRTYCTTSTVKFR